MTNSQPAYVLVTAAYNEEAYIGRTIESVVAQTLLPRKWVIVSDGSTDRTDEIVERYAKQNPFIQLVRITEEHPRNFTAQVYAITRGVQSLGDVEFQFIANLDADVSFEPDYYRKLLDEFHKDPSLGLAGGYIYEKNKGVFASRPTNGEHSVAHAVQMFRRECFEAVGGYVPLPYGGPDWHAQVVARMKGWRVRAFPQLPVFHYRPTGSADRLFRDLFRQGRMDYSLGVLPLFEIMKLVRRARFKPFVLGSLVRFSGFLWGYCKREPRIVSREFVQYLREEQRSQIRQLFSSQRSNQAQTNLKPTA